MLIIPPTKFRKHGGRTKPQRATQAPPAQELILESAVFDNDTVTVTLTFDRAIDIAGIVVGGDIIVNDAAVTGNLYEAYGATLAAPNIVSVNLQVVGEPTGALTTLTASAATGIVAVDDGGTWAGTTNTELPFP